MDCIIKFNNQASGRDKLFRLAQYSSRIIWANLETKNSSKDLINKLKNLEYTLSTARKLYRFGKCGDTLYTALNSLKLSDPVLRRTITLSRINMALYLFCDHILWLGRIGLADIDKNKWSRVSYKLWLYYLVMNLSRDAYEILRIFENYFASTSNQSCKIQSCKPSNLDVLFDLLKSNKHVAVDTLKNGCDVCLPLAQLGYLTVSPRTVGILGVISSIAGMLPLIDTSLKLSP